MEKKNSLFLWQDLKIFQDSEGFNFALDSILLAKFVTVKKSTKKILDIGTGNAPIPLILTTKTTAEIIGVEIQEKSYELAQKSVAYNKKDDQIKLIFGDINKIWQKFGNEVFDTIVCNPPFFKQFSLTKQNMVAEKTTARHEVSLLIEDIFKIARQLLVNGGNIALVHRPERLVEIISIMRANNIEPKRVRFIYPKKGRRAHILLIEGRKNGKVGLTVEPPLVIHRADGNYTKEAMAYFKEE